MFQRRQLPSRPQLARKIVSLLYRTVWVEAITTFDEASSFTPAHAHRSFEPDPEPDCWCTLNEEDVFGARRCISTSRLDLDYCRRSYPGWIRPRGPKFQHFSAAAVRLEAASWYHDLHIRVKSDFTFFYEHGIVPGFLQLHPWEDRACAHPFEAPKAGELQRSRAARQWRRALTDPDTPFWEEDVEVHA